MDPTWKSVSYIFDSLFHLEELVNGPCCLNPLRRKRFRGSNSPYDNSSSHKPPLPEPSHSVLFPLFLISTNGTDHSLSPSLCTRKEFTVYLLLNLLNIVCLLVTCTRPNIPPSKVTLFSFLWGLFTSLRDWDTPLSPARTLRMISQVSTRTKISLHTVYLSSHLRSGSPRKQLSTLSGVVCPITYPVPRPLPPFDSILGWTWPRRHHPKSPSVTDFTWGQGPPWT